MNRSVITRAARMAGLAGLCALTLAFPAMAGGRSEGAKIAAVSITAPAGFADLAEPQRAVVDVYLGGVRVAEAQATFAPGTFRFADPAALVAGLPDIRDKQAVTAVLAAPDLAPHAEAVCQQVRGSADCPRLAPDVAAIVFDRDHYRVDLFVNPRMLTVHAASALQYLPSPQNSLSLVNALGATVAGTVGQAQSHYLQSNSVFSYGPARLEALVSQSDTAGFATETLVAELDRPGLRYSLGAFWAPGTELVGRQKILGAGIASQFDTRLDRDQFEGSPLLLFLDQKSRVDIIVDGHIAGSRVYDAGNQMIDTSALPEGAYNLVLRIVGSNGDTREERRFFSRSSALAPMGHDRFYAYAGALVTDDRGLVGHVSRTPLVQAGWSHRLSPGLAIEAGVIGTDAHQWFEAGATVLRTSWRLDTSLDVSGSGGFGLFGHLASNGYGRLSFNLDGRIVRDASDGDFVTVGSSATGAGATQRLPVGSYTQLSANLGYRIGSGGRIGVVGTYWKGQGRSDYAIGPTVRLPVLRRHGIEVVMDGDFAFTSEGRRGTIGLSVRLDRSRATYAASGGARLQPDGASGTAESFGSAGVTLRRDDVLGARVEASASVNHEGASDYALGQVDARGPNLLASASVLQPLGSGDETGTQYALAAHTNLVVGPGTVAFNAATMSTAMIVASVQSETAGDRFEVLVNNVPMAMVRGGGSVSISLPAYRAYDVRIRARGGSLSSYDSSSRHVGLYPGNVARFDWKAEAVFAVFGRLRRPDGAPLGGARLSIGSEIADSDPQGRFMIQVGSDRQLVARLADGSACEVALGDPKPANGFFAAGDVTCRPMINATQRPRIADAK